MIVVPRDVETWVCKYVRFLPVIALFAPNR